MKNKKYFIPLLCLAVLTISGCGTNKNTDTNNSQNKNQSQQQQNSQKPQRIMNENFIQGNLNNLEVGKKAMIMGTANNDGTVVAHQVIIANSDADFNQFGPNRNRETNGNGQENSQGNDPQQNRNTWNSQNGERPDFGQFQNLSEEEREQFRAQRGNFQNLSEEERAQMREQMGSRGFNGGNRPAMNRSMTHLNGEITDKDETTITLKLQDGSTKLIFVFEETFVDIIKENENNNIAPEENRGSDLETDVIEEELK